MNKIEIKKENIRAEIEGFYDPKVWRFITVNGSEIEDGFEVNWIFCKIGKNEKLKVLFCSVGYDEEIATIADLIPSAYYGEAELFDLMGIKFQNAKAGLFLEPDVEKAPLRRKND